MKKAVLLLVLGAVVLVGGFFLPWASGDTNDQLMLDSVEEVAPATVSQVDFPSSPPFCGGLLSGDPPDGWVVGELKTDTVEVDSYMAHQPCDLYFNGHQISVGVSDRPGSTYGSWVAKEQDKSKFPDEPWETVLDEELAMADGAAARAITVRFNGFTESADTTTVVAIDGGPRLISIGISTESGASDDVIAAMLDLVRTLSIVSDPGASDSYQSVAAGVWFVYPSSWTLSDASTGALGEKDAQILTAPSGFSLRFTAGGLGIGGQCQETAVSVTSHGDLDRDRLDKPASTYVASYLLEDRFFLHLAEQGKVPSGGTTVCSNVPGHQVLNRSGLDIYFGINQQESMTAPGDEELREAISILASLADL